MWKPCLKVYGFYGFHLVRFNFSGLQVMYCIDPTPSHLTIKKTIHILVPSDVGSKKSPVSALLK